MHDAYQIFASDVGQRIISKDYDGVHGLFASWLQEEVSASELQSLLEEQIQEIAEAAEQEGPLHPADFRVSGNNSTLEGLREPDAAAPRSIAAEVTPANFRKWVLIQFLPAENETDLDIDAYLDWWMIVVEADGAARIGYFEIHDPD